MRFCICFFLLALAAVQAQVHPAHVVAVADYTDYNAGHVVRIRLHPATRATVSIRYAGETGPIATAISVSGSDYQSVWKIPRDARTGRYEIDLTLADNKRLVNATSFAVHRQLAKVLSVELDKTFYTSGDSVDPTITVRNVSDRPLTNLQVEFEPYTYPWIAPEPDEPPMWKHIVDRSLSLGPGEQKEFNVKKAAVVQAGKEPVAIYYSVVIRDSRDPDHIYDLVFAPPAFTIPPQHAVTEAISVPLPLLALEGCAEVAGLSELLSA